MPTKDIDKRIMDIIEAATLTEEFVGGMGMEEFIENEMACSAVERKLQVITESAIAIGEEQFNEIFSEIELHELRGLGNRLRHEYGMIDREQIYITATEDVPIIKKQCQAELDRIREKKRG